VFAVYSIDITISRSNKRNSRSSTSKSFICHPRKVAHHENRPFERLCAPPHLVSNNRRSSAIAVITVIVNSRSSKSLSLGARLDALSFGSPCSDRFRALLALGRYLLDWHVPY